jgi:hypothetical protein
MTNHEMLSRRVLALERVVIALLRENAHQFVGGVAFAEDSIATIREAGFEVAAPPEGATP